MPFQNEYKKLKLIGRGSFAAVYKVRHKTLGYIRAIKISNEQVDNEQDKAYVSFLNECKLLLQIGNGCHPNIVHIYQPRLINGRALVEMDYVDGITMTEYIRQHRFVPMSEFWNFATGILGAVGYCHADLYKFLMDPDSDNLESDPADGSKFLITPDKERELRAKYCVNHNDLHSNNIMRRNYDGAYVLLDFGLAIQSEHCVKSSSRGAGAHEYSSPEKLNGENITSESDVYSLGILMYEMLAGTVPFVMGNSGSMADINRLYDRQLHEQPAPIEPLRKAAFEAAFPGETYRKDYPDELEAVIMRCLEKKPSDRFPDAKAAMEALSAAKAMASVDSTASDETVAALKADIERLTEENRKLRSRIDASGYIGSENQSRFNIGQEINGGRICYIDSSGEHGLIIARQSDMSMKWLRKVDEEDYELFTFNSKMWYKENCFIIPRGTHLPNMIELRNIMPHANVLGLNGLIWIGNDINNSHTAFDLASGRVVENSDGVNRFIALKAF